MRLRLSSVFLIDLPECIIRFGRILLYDLAKSLLTINNLHQSWQKRLIITSPDQRFTTFRLLLNLIPRFKDQSASHFWILDWRKSGSIQKYYDDP